MTTTLIVRDALLAIQGTPLAKGEPRAHLIKRIAEVKRLEERSVEECMEVLGSVAHGEGADLEALEALMIIGLAKPSLAERLGVSALERGQELATKLERAAEFDHTLAVLEVLHKYFTNNEPLERQLAQLMSRQGTVKDLVQRYFERAKKLAAEGRHGEAAGWLREVMQLDPSRRDAARMMRNLRFKKVKQESSRKQKSTWPRLVFLCTLLSIGGAFGVLREQRLRREYDAMPKGAIGSAEAQARRLENLDRFFDRNPVWLGAFHVLAERSELRVQVGLHEERLRQQRQADERARAERLESAELSRRRGLLFAQTGDLQEALRAFREAIAYGGEEWVHHERVSRDISDLETHLTDQQ